MVCRGRLLCRPHSLLNTTRTWTLFLASILLCVHYWRLRWQVPYAHEFIGLCRTIQQPSWDWPSCLDWSQNVLVPQLLAGDIYSLSNSCLGRDARQYLLEDQLAVQRSCILPRTFNRGATCNPSSRPSTRKRGLDKDWDPTAPSSQQHPSIRFMLQAILNVSVKTKSSLFLTIKCHH